MSSPIGFTQGVAPTPSDEDKDRALTFLRRAGCPDLDRFAPQLAMEFAMIRFKAVTDCIAVAESVERRYPSVASAIMRQVPHGY